MLLNLHGFSFKIPGDGFHFIFLNVLKCFIVSLPVRREAVRCFCICMFTPINTGLLVTQTLSPFLPPSLLHIPAVETLPSHFTRRRLKVKTESGLFQWITHRLSFSFSLSLRS